MSGDTLRHLTVCLLLAAAAVAQHNLPEPTCEPVAEPDWSRVPRRLGDWVDEDLPVNKAVAEYLRAQAMLSRRYRKGDQELHVSAVFGTQWRSLHSPAGCFFSQGWQALKREQVTLPAPENCPHPGPLHAETMVVQQGNRYMAVTYLYAYPGGTTASWVEQCYRVTRGGARKGGIVIIVEGTTDLSGIDRTLAAEAELLGLIYPHLVEGWYDGGRQPAER